MPTNQLIHRRVIVTGGLGALGRQVGAELSARGARVALVDRAASVAIDGVEAVFGGVDLGEAASTSNAFGQIAGRLGGIDALVNIAGGFAWETLESGSIETWDRLYAMNVRTAAIASHEVLPYLLREKSARIVNVGALAALKDRNVTVNAVLPSIIDTPANRAAMPDADTSRWVAADQLAAVIAFLLSDDASAVTGACLPVAGRV
jgi:NAD(P)-dependent dehydrogenase (short-subunit alcohol dehydrogenase family)